MFVFFCPIVRTVGCYIMFIYLVHSGAQEAKTAEGPGIQEWGKGPVHRVQIQV